MSEKKSSVERVYKEVRQMAIDFSFKPGQRINESVLATELNASRTPLREALNRLTAQGYLSYSAGAGFYCRALPIKPEIVCSSCTKWAMRMHKSSVEFAQRLKL